MGLELVKIVINPTGGTGVSSGGDYGAAVAGWVDEIYLDYGMTSAVTNVTIIEEGRSVPILAVSNNQTDGAYYPRKATVNPVNVTFGSDGAVSVPIVSRLYASMTGGNNATPGLTVYAKIRTV